MKNIFLKLFLFFAFILVLFFQKNYIEATIKWDRCDNSSKSCTDFCQSKGKICVNRCTRIYDPSDKSYLYDKTSSYPKSWNNVGLFHEEATYDRGWHPYGGGAGYCSDTKSPLPASPYFQSNLSMYCNLSFNVYCCCADTCKDANCDGNINPTPTRTWNITTKPVCPTGMILNRPLRMFRIIWPQAGQPGGGWIVLTISQPLQITQC